MICTATDSDPPESSDRDYNAMYYKWSSRRKNKNTIYMMPSILTAWPGPVKRGAVSPSQSSHLHHLGTVCHAYQALSNDNAILFASEELVPPTKEEVAGDKLEPRRE
jgi:hypothetical protein